VSTGQPLKKRADLELIFLNADEALEDIIIDSEVEISYLRTKAGEVIGNNAQSFKASHAA
jgi:hypothetical protein